MISVKNLTKRYGDNLAVDGIDFELHEGRVYGFLGPNGAGKSTTMNIVTGCLAPTEGSVILDGTDIFDDPKSAKKLIGYLPEIPPVYGDMTPEEYLSFVAQAKGEKGKAAEEDVTRVCMRTGIEKVRDRLIRNLSKGYRQRVGIAQAMLGNPKYIILDEPTVGLDPKQIIEIRTLIRELGKEHTVILSSRILAEVQEVCDELIIISGGRIAAAGTQTQITESLGGDGCVALTVKGQCTKELFAETETKVTSFAEHEGLADITLTYARGSDVREKIFDLLTGAGLKILEMHTEEPTLEDIFLALTEEHEEKFDETLPPSVAEAAELMSSTDSPDASGNDEVGSETESEGDRADGAEDTGETADNDGDDYTPLFGGDGK